MSDDETTPEGEEAVEETPETPEEVPEAESAEAPEADASEPAEEPASEATDDAAPTEPGAPTEAEAEADAVPEPVTSEEGTSESAEEAPAATPAKRAKSEKRDVVPGADLEPIAISEEREMTAEERAAAEAEAEERAAREAQSTAEDDEEEVTPRTVNVPADAQIQATGKRKSAVARVIVRSGDGGFQINDRPIEQYFPSALHQAIARQPLVNSGYDGNVDVKVRVHGGGISGQAGAVRHGIARALTELEPELRGDLKRRGLLTRDDRRKERKKAGLKKARKRPQFSKR